MAQQKNDCANKLKSGNNSDKSKCRGPMNDKCSASLDGTCRNSGLYDIMLKNPQPAAAYPDACNSSLTGYSDQSCFAWVVNNLFKKTIAFDYKNFADLPKLIGNSISTTTSTNTSALRVLQTVTKNDPTSTDTKCQVTGSIVDADLTVDSATATTVPNPNTYVSSLQTATTNTALNSSYLKTSLIFMSYVIISLFF